MLMRNERLAGLRTHYEDESHLLTIRRDGEVAARGDLETAEGRAAIEAFFAANFTSELNGPPKLLSGGGHSFSDVAKKVVSIINLGSIRAIENMVGLPVHPLRFRANLYVSGWPAWQELELVGQTLAIGDARLRVVKRITRCAAVNVDPETAARDLDIPPMLMRRLGHNECGDLRRGDRRRRDCRRRHDRHRTAAAALRVGKGHWPCPPLRPLRREVLRGLNSSA